MKKSITKQLCVIVAFISLHGTCLCNKPAGAKQPRGKERELSNIHLKLVPQGSTELTAADYHIKFTIEQEANSAEIDKKKLELKIIQEGGKARLTYQNKEVQATISATALPAFGDLISIQLEPADKKPITFTFQLFYKGNPIGNIQRFNWMHGGGETLLKAIRGKSKTKEDIEKLINSQNINYQDSVGNSPLFYAIRQEPTDARDVAIIKLLLDKGADVNLSNVYGTSPLIAAIVYKKDLEFIELLIGKGAKVNKPGTTGETPLNWAMIHEDLPLIELLLNHGANVNITKQYGDTPLFKAALSGNKAIAELLLNYKPDVDKANNEGVTPLLEAVQRGHKDIVDLLVKHQANVNKADHKGVTPLWHAVQRGDKEMVQLLLSNGADVNQANKNGKTPLQLAQEKGLKEIEELLRKAK